MCVAFPALPLVENVGPVPIAEGFEVLSLEGSGGMGDVWKAFQPVEQRLVALKILRRAPGGEERRRHAEDRFRREIALAAQFDHPPLHGSMAAAGRRTVACSM